MHGIKSDNDFDNSLDFHSYYYGKLFSNPKVDENLVGISGILCLIYAVDVELNVAHNTFNFDVDMAGIAVIFGLLVGCVFSLISAGNEALNNAFD